MLGMTYPPGYLDNPKNHRSRSCLVVRGPSGNLLVDCPPELRLQCTGARITEIDAVIQTHSHADHIMGMDDLRSICIKTGRAIPVYTLPRYQEDIRRIYPYAFAEFPAGVFVPRFDLHDIRPEEELCGMRVQSFVVEHGQVPVIGIRIGGFAYITDVSRVPDDVWRLLEGLDTFIVGATRYREHPNHFTFEQALEAAAKVGAKQTYLTHLSADYDHDPVDAALPKGVNLAYDGLRVQVS